MEYARHDQAPESTWLPGSRRRKRLLLLLAGLLGGLCAAVAFVFLVVRDHGVARVMVNDQAAPHAPAAKLPVKVAVLPPVQTIPASESKTFTADKEKRTAQLGPVRLRLLRTDQSKENFDVSITVGRRSHAHRHLKVNEPLWITVNQGAAIELVATAISAGGIEGYWKQSDRAPQLSLRAKKPK